MLFSQTRYVRLCLKLYKTVYSLNIDESIINRFTFKSLAPTQAICSSMNNLDRILKIGEILESKFKRTSSEINNILNSISKKWNEKNEKHIS